MLPLLALLLFVVSHSAPGAPRSDGLNSLQALRLAQMLGLPTPCAGVEGVDRMYWGSRSADGTSLVVGVNLIRSVGGVAKECASQGPAYLVERGEVVLEIPGAREAGSRTSVSWPSRMPTGYRFVDRAGAKLGGAQGRFAVFRCGDVQGITGFLPGSNHLVGGGAEAVSDGILRTWVRCIGADGTTLWDLETAGIPEAIVVNDRGELDVYFANTSLRLSAEGAYLGDLTADLGRYGRGERFILRSH